MKQWALALSVLLSSQMVFAGNLLCSYKAGDADVKTVTQKIEVSSKVTQYKIASASAGEITVSISGNALELAVHPHDSREYFVIASEGTVANGAHLLVNSQELEKLLDVACYVK